MFLLNLESNKQQAFLKWALAVTDGKLSDQTKLHLQQQKGRRAVFAVGALVKRIMNEGFISIRSLLTRREILQRALAQATSNIHHRKARGFEQWKDLLTEKKSEQARGFCLALEALAKAQLKSAFNVLYQEYLERNKLLTSALNKLTHAAKSNLRTAFELWACIPRLKYFNVFRIEVFRGSLVLSRVRLVCTLPR